MTVSPRFLTKLDIRHIDGERFELLGPLMYQAGDGRVFTVDVGFVTDFASIPRPLWWRYPKSGPWNPAATLHDYLYVRNGVTRADADALFREAMETCGVYWWTRNVMYRAVRIGGARVWRRYRAADAVAV